jgi:hypothetical protein
MTAKKTATGPMKSFNFKSGRSATPETVPFKLNGKVIRRKAELDGLTLLEFVAKMVSILPDDVTPDALDRQNLAALKVKDTVSAMTTILDLLELAIVDEDWQLFRDAVQEQGSGVGLEELMEIALYFFEVFGGLSAMAGGERPTAPSLA